MKISDVRIREVLIPRIYETYASDKLNLQDDDHKRSHYQIIELFTDEGFVGLGEVSDIANRMNPLTAGELRDILNKTAVGFELDYWPLIYKKTAQELPKNIHPELKGLTLFGLEIALLDLVGKKYGSPLFELLGGQYRQSVEVCWVLYLRGDISIDEELNALSLEVKEKRKEGFSAFKMKVGDDHDRDMQRISKFRNICGPEVYLRVDASGTWEEKEAIEKINDMSQAGVNACESPLLVVNRAVANDNPERINKNAEKAAQALAKIRKNSPIKIIEHLADLDDGFTSSLIRYKAVDIVNIIPSQGGGILRGQRLIHTSQTASLPALLGSTVELGIGTAAFVHLAVSSENVTISSDLVGPGILVDDIISEPFLYNKGKLEPYKNPGLGVKLDENKIKKWELTNK